MHVNMCLTWSTYLYTCLYMSAQATTNAQDRSTTAWDACLSTCLNAWPNACGYRCLVTYNSLPHHCHIVTELAFQTSETTGTTSLFSELSENRCETARSLLKTGLRFSVSDLSRTVIANPGVGCWGSGWSWSRYRVIVNK